MPKIERKPGLPKKKEKSAKPAVDGKATKQPTAPSPTETPTPASDAAPKKEKKEKKEAKDKGANANGGATKKSGGKIAPAAAAEDSGEPVPSMIDLRVGHIVDSKQ